MPYIEQPRRSALDNRELQDVQPLSAGELNYAVTRLCLAYLHHHGLRYDTLNAIVGALECAKIEFSRRIVAPYEETKMKLNGDVL